MLKDQFEKAKVLIEAKKYAEARNLLKTLDHPKALEWLQKLDALEKKAASPHKSQPSNELLIFVAVLVGLFWLGVGLFVIRRFSLDYFYLVFAFLIFCAICAVIQFGATREFKKAFLIFFGAGGFLVFGCAISILSVRLPDISDEDKSYFDISIQYPLQEVCGNFYQAEGENLVAERCHNEISQLEDIQKHYVVECFRANGRAVNAPFALCL